MYYVVNNGYLPHRTREDAEKEIKKFEKVQDFLRGSHDYYEVNVVKEETDKTTVVNFEFESEDGKSYLATGAIDDLNDENVEVVEGQEKGVTVIDVFKTHHEPDSTYIDLEKDLIISYKAYYTARNLYDVELVESWLRKLLSHEFGKISFEGRFEDYVEYE